MKKNLLILSCLFVLINSCIKQNDSEQKVSLRQIELDDATNHFVSDFMKSKNNSECIYELYVDKKTKDDYVLTICNLPVDTIYFSTHFPVNYAIINNKMVFIYSGIEDFINKEKYYPGYNIIKEKENNKWISYESIVKVFNKDTSFCDYGFYPPFMDLKILPPIHLKPPPKESE